MDELQTAGMLVDVYLHIVLLFDIRFHSLEVYLYVLNMHMPVGFRWK